MWEDKGMWGKQNCKDVREKQEHTIKAAEEFQRLLLYVELAGVEPASKQGNHTLSTRLFRTSVFERQQDPDHQLPP